MVRFAAGNGPVRTVGATEDTMADDNLPASGAWCVGDPVGSRRFITVSRPVALDAGGRLDGLSIAYETWGTLNDDRSNAVLICHAWTGDSHVAGPAEDGHPTPGWWERVVGPGLPIDTDRWFVVCSNVIGGCQGSTGPASPHPVDGRPYGPRFPTVTVRDMVRAQGRLADALGIRKWHAVVGGSMGGMQVLEWAVMFPERVGGIVPIASCAQSTAQQIAWGAIGRRAIRLDPRWRGGDYYGAADGDGPTAGLSIARMVSQVTFRSDNVFTEKFGRSLLDGDDTRTGMDLWDRFEVEGYLDHHGAKLARRFDANSYLVIGKAMDLHDVARGRTDLAKAMHRATMPALVMGISSDVLYPTYQQREIHALLGDRSRYMEIESPHGHDAFLIEHDQVGPPIGRFLADVAAAHG